MYSFWWARRGNLTLIILRSERVNGHNSNLLTAGATGVSQGSVLGPLLLLIISMIYTTAMKNYELTYLQVLLPYISPQIVLLWGLYANRLIALNTEKINFVIFHYSRKKLCKQISISIDIKFFDQISWCPSWFNLSWRPTVHELSKKVAIKTIGILSSPSVSLYYFIVLPNLYLLNLRS